MTIEQAVQAYHTRGENSVSPAFREIINKMIDSNTKTDFSNDSYLDALYLTDVMFVRSQKTVRMLTGPKGGDFLEVLSASLVSAIERVQKNGGFVRMVLLSNEIPVWVRTLQDRFKGTFQVARAQSPNPIKHFIVCDSTMARMEELHGPIDQTADAESIKARVSFNEPSRAKLMEEYFDGIWKVVEKFPINT